MRFGAFLMQPMMLWFFLAAAGSGQTTAVPLMKTQQAMHARILGLYDFSPGKVTADTRTAKSKEMDEFWDEVTKNKQAELPLLRAELADARNPPFFFEDGSTLLLSLSDAPDDRKLAVGALARTNLGDIASHAYLFQIHALAEKGVDITPAALHMVDDRTFMVYLPEHAYQLDQGACLIEALLPLPNEVWMRAAIDRLRMEHDVTAQKSLLLLLFYAQTDEADREVERAAGPDSSKEIREFAESILKHERELGVGKHPSHATEEKVREQRRKRMFAISDEAMDDLESLTRQIAQARTLR
jgi:hypothetical protein